MRVSDIVNFSKESYFNGAVQTEWFYDDEKNKRIAQSYVFHGPKYYGVSSSDINLGQHKLIDTASFAKNLTEKLYAKKPENCFVMTIAGYGTGKSHLAVSLGALFSGNAAISATVTENIALADADISKYVRNINTKKNLVIVLNGMNNFNLDSEILRCTRICLNQNGLDDSALKQLTKSYEIAKHFVERTFIMCQAQFESTAKKHNLTKSGMALKEYLLENVEFDQNALAIINNVYEDINGDGIHWDRGISAGEIFTILQSDLCGDGKPFNKVLVLFDEFGRYIEYAASNPAIAGEASLQQIFESVQGADGKIIFVGFIQNELDAYLSRIEKTANIVRYVGRYKGSENLFLSSNFETILSNLINKVDVSTHERILDNALECYDKFHHNIETSLNRWDKSTVKKSVWTTSSLYKNVVLKGCYPLHPITVWLLSNMHNWMQQRSAITFASEMVEKISNSDIQGAWLPYVYPIDLIKSSVYEEMLNSEEKGLVQSQFCMLYRDILLKIGSKLTENELSTLQAILVINIGRFSFLNQEDAIKAIRYCSNLKSEEVETALKSLENLHGVVIFDENVNTFDLVAEANGFNEFKRIFARYRLGVSATIEDCGAEIHKELLLDNDVETSFAQKHNISSVEWAFAQTLISAQDITEEYLKSSVANLVTGATGETARGFIIYAYCSENAQSESTKITVLYKTLELQRVPIIILLLDDAEHEVLSALSVIKALKKFSVADTERFKKHISDQLRAQNKKVCKQITTLLSQKLVIDSNGVHSYSGRLNALCSEKFEELYYSALPFMFDGFEKKAAVQAKKYLSNICIKLFDRTLMNIQSYQALTQDEKNRVKASLSTSTETSWKVFDDSCQLLEPQNELVLTLYREVCEVISYDAMTSFSTLLSKYTAPPYGMNENALSLFLFYFLAKQENYILSFYGQERLTASHLIDKIFKQGKLQRLELLKVRVQKNANVEVDLVGNVAKEILLNTSVEQFGQLKIKFDNILAQENVSTENQLIVAQAKIRLDETLKLKNAIYAKLAKAEEYLQQANGTLVIHKFIKIFDTLLDTDLPIMESLPFIYSDEFKKEEERIRIGIHKILDDKYEWALKNLKCDITQLSQIKSIYTNISRILSEQGYQELALKTGERIQTLEQELKAKQKYEASIIECMKELALHGNVENYTYKKCAEALSTLNGLSIFLGAAKDLPVSVSEPLLDKILRVLSELNKRMESIQNDFTEGICKFHASTNAADLRDAEVTLKRLLQLEFVDKNYQTLCDSMNNISAAMSMIESIPTSLDELKIFLEQLSATSDVPCKVAVYGEVACAEQKYYAEQENWIKRFLEPLDVPLNGMSSFDCMNWMEKTKILPKVLEQTTICRYREALEKVKKQLHNNRIQGVVSMFNALTDEEKEECIKILSSK